MSSKNVILAASDIDRLRGKEIVTVRCPFCDNGAVYSVCDDLDGEPPYATHTLPTCKEFDEMDLLPFLKAARSRFQETS